MKMLFIFLLLSSAAFGQSVADRVKKFENAKHYEVVYDKFQKQTKVRTSVSLSAKGKGWGSTRLLELHPSLHVWDDGRSDLILLASGGTSSYHNRPTLRLLLDGDLLELSSNDIDSIVGFTVPAKAFERIAAAKLVEVQLGNFEGKLNPKAHSVFKNLHSLTAP